MSNGKTVLVTGGAGYIGSHCVVTLQQAGYKVVALDNFANSVNDDKNQSAALKRVEQITGHIVHFYRCDLLNKAEISKIFELVKNIHFEYISISVQYLILYTYLAPYRFGHSFSCHESGWRIDAIPIDVLQKQHDWND